MQVNLMYVNSSNVAAATAVCMRINPRRSHRNTSSSIEERKLIALTVADTTARASLCESVPEEEDQ